MLELALFGSPVSHSLSPRIHQAFGRACGIDLRYRAVECERRHFADVLTDFHAAGGAGANVTVPLKEQAFDLTGRHSTEAVVSGAVNTLIREADGWAGANTDGVGMLRDLIHGVAFDPAGRRLLVIGAGGAARGILPALLARRPAHCTIVNRTESRARQLAGHLLDQMACDIPIDSLPLEQLPEATPADLIVHASAAGHQAHVISLPAHVLMDDGLVYDLNYGAAARPLAAECRQLGLRYRDGLGMLVHQAAAAFQLWTGVEPAVAPVLAALSEDRPHTGSHSTQPPADA